MLNFMIFVKINQPKIHGTSHLIYYSQLNDVSQIIKESINSYQ